MFVLVINMDIKDIASILRNIYKSQEEIFISGQMTYSEFCIVRNIIRDIECAIQAQNK